MTKDLLLKLIAEKGYDVLYGAKRNFASYDILNDIPKYSSFVSLIFGVSGLCYTNNLSNNAFDWYCWYVL